MYLMTKYDYKQIARELNATASGESYYGNSLYVSLDMPWITKQDALMLHRYLHGSELSSDRFKLQNLAILIHSKGEVIA